MKQNCAYLLTKQNYLKSEYLGNSKSNKNLFCVNNREPEVEFMNVFSQRRVDSQSLRVTLSYESTLMEFRDNLPKSPEFFSIHTVTKDEWTCLNKIIN